MIPNEIKMCNSIHINPCYKNVARILSSKKEKKETSTVRRSLTRGCSSNETEKNLYPFICQFCKQYRKQLINRLIPTKLTTKNGKQNIKRLQRSLISNCISKLKMLILLQKNLVIKLNQVI